MKIKDIETIQEAKEVFPIMNELRTHLDELKYLDLLQASRASGYKLIGAFDLDSCVGLMGYRILTDFVHGKHVYIDDLVVSSASRSQGIGSKLLKHAEQVAAANNCTRLRLCTGIDNEAGKRFYEKNAWDLRAVVYKKKLQ